MIFNTHSHINDKNSEIPLLIQECLEKQVNKIAAVGYDYISSLKAIEIAKKYHNIYAICGLQPEEIQNFNGDFSLFNNLFNDPYCIGIGEIGLDYYYGKNNKELQIKYFEEQLKLATHYPKPVMIHCREAHEDTFNLLSKYADYLDGIILHCYTGSVEMMERYLSLNAYISISGIVTFKNAKTIKEVVMKCPLEKLLVETDDPYLTPVPFRGQENHPAYVYYVVEEIAKIKNLSFNEIAQITYNNAKKVFHL